MQTELGRIDHHNVGDIPIEDVRRYGYALINWMCEYFRTIDSYPVLAQTKPGDIKNALPNALPETGESFEAILRDFNEIILPGVTHWNHPNFFAYFSISGSAPGIFGEILSDVLNVNGMLWKTSPSATELEETVVVWAKEMLSIPQEFFGMIVDTASVATLTAIIAAREAAGLNIRINGFPRGADAPALCLYCSEQAHSSVDKAAVIAGIGIENIRKIPTDEQFRMRPDVLEQAVRNDSTEGRKPFAVVATIGTTSTTSVDPVPEIGAICRRHHIWLHVDGAYAGMAAAIPEYRWIMDGFEYVDSYVTNPHKWLFTPIDASLFFVRSEQQLRQAFSIIPEYLTTSVQGTAIDFMNYGPQLGRRFRSLKLWFVMRMFGRDGLTNRLREHIRLARLFQSFIESNRNFEIMAPVPFSVVCFRINPPDKLLSESELEQVNTRLMDMVNATGKVYISHTKLNGRYTLRFAVGNIRTTENHIRAAWEVIRECAEQI